VGGQPPHMHTQSVRLARLVSQGRQQQGWQRQEGQQLRQPVVPPPGFADSPMKDSRKSSTPKLDMADPKYKGVMSPRCTAAVSSSSPSTCPVQAVCCRSGPTHSVRRGVCVSMARWRVVTPLLASCTQALAPARCTPAHLQQLQVLMQLHSGSCSHKVHPRAPPAAPGPHAAAP